MTERVSSFFQVVTLLISIMFADLRLAKNKNTLFDRFLSSGS